MLERVRIIYIYVLLSEQRGIYKVAMHSPELIGYRAARLYHIVLVLVLRCVIVRQLGLLCRRTALYCRLLWCCLWLNLCTCRTCLLYLSPPVLRIWYIRYAASDVLGIPHYELCIGGHFIYTLQAVVGKELAHPGIIIQEVIAEYLRQRRLVR